MRAAPTHQTGTTWSGSAEDTGLERRIEHRLIKPGQYGWSRDCRGECSGGRRHRLQPGR
ncbi:hypothetical protein BDD12DRAFT_854108 [Trichophaea hybrida]|nr:hypothetical protein BDD12DRAFT_854108 [Trichophaea hybrida]